MANRYVGNNNVSTQRTTATGAALACRGPSDRRTFLKIGALTFGATSLTLADLYRAEAVQAPHSNAAPNSHKAVINIYLPGGPSHMDMWDLKPNAPVEIRGEFDPTQHLEDALNSMRIVLAADESFRTGKTIEL